MALFSFFIQKCVCVCQVGQWQCFSVFHLFFFSVLKTFNKVLANIALDRHHICHKLHKFSNPSPVVEERALHLDATFQVSGVPSVCGCHCISIWIYIIMFIYTARCGLHISARGLPNSSYQNFMLNYHKTAVLRYKRRSLGHYHINGAQY